MNVIREKVRRFGSLPLCEGAVEEPSDDGEVLALIVGGQDDRVLVAGVLGSHGEWICR